MGSSSELQELIHINLSLLQDSGNKIQFEEGMFRDRNIPGFEKVGYALLMILDPIETKKSIPWPLLDDKSLRMEFRNKFVKFIKMINAKYERAKIPEVTASSLHFPGGLAFLQFMYRLSSFALELQLRRILSPTENKELLEKFDTSKDEPDLETSINIVTSARYEQEHTYRSVAEYNNVAQKSLKNLQDVNKRLEKDIRESQEALKNCIAGLKVEGEMKNQLQDLSCKGAMLEWNQRTAEKAAELRSASKRLNHVRDLSTSVCQLIQVAVNSEEEKISLDGMNLRTTSAVCKLIEEPITNNRGDVRLGALLKAGQMGLSKLVTTVSSGPHLLPLALETQVAAADLAERLNKPSAALEKLKVNCKEEIAELRPIMYAQTKEKIAEDKVKVPDWFKYVGNRPTAQFGSPSFAAKSDSPYKSVRKTRFSGIVGVLKQKNGNLAVPKKTRRLHEPSFHTPAVRGFQSGRLLSSATARPLPSTSVQPQPTSTRYKTRLEPSARKIPPPKVHCKKSLYGKLPTGARPLVDECESVQPLEPEFSSPFTKSSNTLFTQPDTSRVSSLRVQPSATQSKRRSIDLIVERYKKLKERQAQLSGDESFKLNVDTS